jgi:hypothetical protein
LEPALAPEMEGEKEEEEGVMLGTCAVGGPRCSNKRNLATESRHRPLRSCCAFFSAIACKCM